MCEPHFNSGIYNAFEFYVPIAMVCFCHNDGTLPTCATRRCQSSCYTAITVIIAYWCFLSLRYWYWLFVYISRAVLTLLNVNKSLTYWHKDSTCMYIHISCIRRYIFIHVYTNSSTSFAVALQHFISTTRSVFVATPRCHSEYWHNMPPKTASCIPQPHWSILTIHHIPDPSTQD